MDENKDDMPEGSDRNKRPGDDLAEGSDRNKPRRDDVPEEGSSDRNKGRKAEARAAIMAKIQKDQAKFMASIESTADESSDSDTQPFCTLCRITDSPQPLCFLVLLQTSDMVSFANNSPRSWENDQVPICATQSEMDPSPTSSSTNLFSFQDFENNKYSSFSKNFQNQNLTEDQTLNAKTDIIISTSCRDPFAPADCAGVHVSSCGHSMHQECLDKMEDIWQGSGEFFCPVCTELANSIIPLLPGRVWKQSSNTDMGSLLLPKALDLMQYLATEIKDEDVVSSQTLVATEMLPSLTELMSVFSNMYSTGDSPSVMLWDTLNYSIKSLEVESRSRLSKASTQMNNAYIASLLLNVVGNLESQTSNHALQRFRALKLFSAAICSGFSLQCSDIERWNWASDPILTRDPFSTMMWVLFCLPRPYLSCEKTFMLLLHLFYAVNVAQVVFAYCLNGQFMMFGSEHRLLDSIHNILGETGFVGPSNDIVKIIRKCSFPFFRRCALLWKILSSTVPIPRSGNEYHLLAAMDCDNELKGVEELESMFKIPSIETTLNDDMLQTLVLKWVSHFQIMFQACKFRCFYSAPALPFRLMQLPRDYEDFMDRYYVAWPCPTCKKPFMQPAVCLLCGAVCSMNSNECCCESICEVHAMKCSAGSGVFLQVKSTRIWRQWMGHGSFGISPYLDIHEESDVYILRGKPLFLNEGRYADLAHLVASHGLYRDCSEIYDTKWAMETFVGPGTFEPDVPDVSDESDEDFWDF